MRQEKVILSFVMVLIGLLVAGVAFYFYQTGKQTSPKQLAIISPSPSLVNTNDELMLEITNPKNETVVSNKSIKLSGKTNPNATVVVVSNSDQQIIKPDKSGGFNTTLILETDQNLITIIALLETGEYKQIQNTITYSTNSF